MGSWNKTCGLTQLPIHDGERVVMFLLVEVVRDYQSYCYNNWAWEIIPLPVYGEYSDYGWMTPDDGQEGKLKAFTHFFERSLTRRKPHREGIAKGPDDLGWNASDDVSGLADKGYVRYDECKDDPFETFEALGEAMHGNLFGMKDYQGKVGEIAHMMIREDAFESLKSVVSLGEGYSDPAVTVDYLKKVLETYDAWKAGKDEEIKAQIETAEAAGDTETATVLKMNLKYGDYANMHLGDEVVEEVLKPLRAEQNLDIKYDHACMDYWFLSYARFPSRGGDTGWVTSSFNTMFKGMVGFKNLFDGYAIQNIFNQLRKSYSPQGGEGSQADTNLMTTKFPLAYLEAAYNIDHRWDEDEDEEEVMSPDMTMDAETLSKTLKASAERKRAEAIKLLREADEDMRKALLPK